MENQVMENQNIYIPTSTAAVQNCDIPAPPNFGKLEGWICPVCGRGVAPGVSFCPCKAGNDSTITWVSPTITVSTANPNSNANSNVTSINSGWGYVTYTDGKSE